MEKLLESGVDSEMVDKMKDELGDFLKDVGGEEETSSDFWSYLLWSSGSFAGGGGLVALISFLV